MPTKKRTQEEHLAECLRTLIGCELENVSLDAAGNVALILKDDEGRVHYVSLLRDPEGNGPGWADIDFARPSPAYDAYLAIAPEGVEAFDISCDLADEVLRRGKGRTP